jgi:hypothetical protein
MRSVNRRTEPGVTCSFIIPPHLIPHKYTTPIHKSKIHRTRLIFCTYCRRYCIDYLLLSSSVWMFLSEWRPVRPLRPKSIARLGIERKRPNGQRTKVQGAVSLMYEDNPLQHSLHWTSDLRRVADKHLIGEKYVKSAINGAPMKKGYECV